MIKHSILSDIEKILNLSRSEKIKLRASPHAKAELEKISEEYRQEHIDMYNSFDSMEIINSHWHTSAGGFMVNPGTFMNSGGSREDPDFTYLKKILPDEMDVKHMFQAIRNDFEVFLTADNKTILRKRKDIEEKHKIKILDPKELISFLNYNLVSTL